MEILKSRLLFLLANQEMEARVIGLTSKRHKCHKNNKK